LPEGERGLPGGLSQVTLGIPARIHLDGAPRHGPARRRVRAVCARADGHRPVPGAGPPRHGAAARARGPVPRAAHRVGHSEGGFAPSTFAWNSLVVAAGSTGLALLLGPPGAYAIVPFKRTGIALALLTARMAPG